MIAIDLKSRRSIYEQVVFGIKEQILAGIIESNTKLPSVRELSKELTVNPNTVQKAFRELEAQGYIYTVAGVGSFARPQQEIKPDQRLVEAAVSKLTDALRELQLLIPDHERFTRIVNRTLTSMTSGPVGSSTRTPSQKPRTAGGEQ